MERISSRQNSHFKLARKLAVSPRERFKASQILIEGTRLIQSYSDCFGLLESTVLVSDTGALRPDIRRVLDTVPSRNTYVLTDALFKEITQVETPEGIAVICGTPEVASKAFDDFRIFLAGVQEPGNLGGLLRTAAAAGATSAHLAKGCTDAWSPKALRGGMGAQFLLPIHENVDLESALTGFDGSIIATSAHAQTAIYDTDLTGPVAMIFGNEGRGLPEAVLSLANQLVHIPMVGKMESLNVAAAAAICCFERLRQVVRVGAGGDSKK
jgi:TrmH family RNA methyltransferase